MKRMFQFTLISTIICSCSFFTVNSNKNNWVITEGHYIIESKVMLLKDSIGDNSIVRGKIFDEYTQLVKPYGTIRIVNSFIWADIDSLGNFNLLFKAGKYKIGFFQSGDSLITDSINFERNSITTIKVYMGSDIMYDYNN